MNGPVQERAEGPEQLRQGERERERREAGWGRGMRGRERGGDAVEKERGGKERKRPGDRQERIERSQVG